MERKENKMGVMPVKRLIVTMSLPMMASMLVQALYNIVDSIFVARISESALTAVTLAFPIQNLMLAFASGTGVGINALLSRSLGERRYEESDAAANTGVLLAFLSSMLFVLVGIFGVGAFIRSQTPDPEIVSHGEVYLRIVCTLSLGLFFQVTFERLLQSTGRTLYSMISQMTGAVVNILLDPVMIFGLLGCPAFGVAGAAYATVIGQTVAAVLAIILNVRKNKDINLSLRQILRPRRMTVRKIYAVGIPSILMVSIGSVMTYLFNRILLVYTSTAQAVFGVYFKLQSFFFMPIFGLNNGLIPVLAYNYGARNKGRIDEALTFSVKLALCVMTAGTIVFELFPRQLLMLFSASPDMMDMGIPALRIIGVHFPVAALCIVMGSVFQAFAKSIYSLIVSIMRQLVVLIPVAWLLSKIGNVDFVWLAFPAAELMSLVASTFFFRKVYREVVKPLCE